LSAVLHIQRLDLALKFTGEDVILRRGTTSFTDLTVRASVRAYNAQEITGGVVVGDIRVTLSPTGLDDAAWVAAGGSAGTTPFNPDRRIPTIGNRVIVQGRNRRIEQVMPVFVNGTLVRIGLQAR